MIGLALRRLGASVLLLALACTALFFLVQLAPGEPALLVLDGRIALEDRAALRRVWGLDRPLAVQYGRWLLAVLRGDWGISFVHARPVRAVVAAHLPPTLLLAASALLIQFGVALPLGVAAARRAGGAADQLIRVGSLLAFSLPPFWTGLMALWLLGTELPIFPAGHMRSVGAESLPAGARLLDLLLHLALPALVLGLTAAGATCRYLRASLLEVLAEDYIRTARATGLTERRVVWVHALRNALGPLVQIFGLSLPLLLSGALVIEVVFSWPGLGRLAYDSILARDHPVVLACTGLTGGLVIAGNWLADLLQAAIDPRLRGD